MTYQIIKCSAKKFCLTEEWLNKIQEEVVKINRITTEAYHLLNIHIRRLIEEKKEIPKLEKNYLIQFFYAVSKGKRNAFIDSEILQTKKDHFSQKEEWKREKIINCLLHAATEMETAIKNNISLHFFKRQYGYYKNKLPKDNLSKDKKKEQEKQLKQKINQINSLQGNNLTEITLPSSIKKSVPYHLISDFTKFLVPMYHMNKEREKPFSLLSLRRGFTLRSIRIDHTTLELWSNSKKYKKQKKETEKKQKEKRQNEKKEEKENKRKRQMKTPNEKEELLSLHDQLWSSYFNLELLRINKKKFLFDHGIVTDGVSVSCQFINLIKPQKKEKKKKKKEDIPIDSLLGKTIVGVDPGKHSILYMTSDNEKIEKRFNYTNIQRSIELGKKKHRKQEKKWKTKEIQESEDVLSKQNSCSIDLDKFKEYLSAQRKVEEILYSHYSKLGKVFFY
jgi:hypothetical protein